MTAAATTTAYPRTRLVLAITLTGLAACGAYLAGADHGRVFDPFTIALAACAIVAALVLVDVEGTLFLGASLVPNICAVVLLGPAPAALVAVVGEVAVLAVDRYRLTAFPLNLFSSVAPNIVAAIAAEHVVGRAAGVSYYIALLAIAGLCVVLNTTLITVLSGVEQNLPIVSRLWSFRRLVPALSINVALAVAAVTVYDIEGLGATIFVLAGILAFAYLARVIAMEREHLSRIAVLAANRGQLVAQVLEAEDRQRRAIAESLHDDVVQTLLVAQQELHDARDMEHPDPSRATEAVAAALGQVRSTIAGTHPSVLHGLGLEAALRMITETHGARCGTRFDVVIACSIPREYERLLFSTARELIANVARHARATRALVRCESQRGELVLRVCDDGIGMSARRESRIEDGHIGLVAVADRANAVGGSFVVESPAGKFATCVRVALPVHGKEEHGAGWRELVPQESYRASASTTTAAVGGPHGPTRAQ